MEQKIKPNCSSTLFVALAELLSMLKEAWKEFNELN
jgi:hypothetical protein